MIGSFKRTRWSSGCLSTETKVFLSTFPISLPPRLFSGDLESDEAGAEALLTAFVSEMEGLEGSIFSAFSVFEQEFCASVLSESDSRSISSGFPETFAGTDSSALTSVVSGSSSSLSQLESEDYKYVQWWNSEKYKKSDWMQETHWKSNDIRIRELGFTVKTRFLSSTSNFPFFSTACSFAGWINCCTTEQSFTTFSQKFSDRCEFR